jgi:hypothetical protein
MRFRGRPTGVFLRPCYTYTPSDFYAKFEKDPLLFNLPPSLWPFVRTHIRGLLGIKQSKRKGLKGKERH